MDNNLIFLNILPEIIFKMETNNQFWRNDRNSFDIFQLQLFRMVLNWNLAFLNVFSRRKI